MSLMLLNWALKESLYCRNLILNGSKRTSKLLKSMSPFMRKLVDRYVYKCMYSV